MPFFNHHEIAFHYQDIGNGFPFVFQHGMGGDTQQILGVFQDPAPYRLITLDCRGHGKTAPLGDVNGLSFQQFSDDLLSLLQHLGLARVMLGGISMGAGVALNFALRYPERVTALVLVRPAWLDAPLPENLKIYLCICALIRRYGADRGREIFQQTEEYLSICQTFPASAASLVKQFTRSHAQEYAAILERLPLDAPVSSLLNLSRISLPTLILVNTSDPVHPHDYGEELQKAIQGARLETITSKEENAKQHALDIDDAILRFFQALT